MKKLKSLFQRNYDGDGLVRNEVVPGTEWVLNGEGVATRKWDGTCCLVRHGVLYKRYDAKHGKTPPLGFQPAQDPDPVTGHWPGWLVVSRDKPEDQWHIKAWDNCLSTNGHPPSNGTYELCGPKIQGNPENFTIHLLVKHGQHVFSLCPREFDLIKLFLEATNVEGIVWWRAPTDPECDKVKIKTRDFGLKR